MYVSGFYADNEISSRISRLAGHRGFSGINAENLNVVKGLSKGRCGAESVPQISAGAVSDGTGIRQ